MVYIISFSFVIVSLVIIDPVQQGDSPLNHPHCQVSAVPELLHVWCSMVAILCVVMYLMGCLFALNHAGTTTVHIRLGTSSMLPVDLHIWGVVFPVCIKVVLECVYCPTVDYIIG